MPTPGHNAPRPARPHDTLPPTRGERQQQTRAALVSAARTAFARDGYHGARLEVIAHEAGYSKGAVYSNFDGKAALFLAVIDADLARADEIGHDAGLPSAAAPHTGACAADTAPEHDGEARLAEARGFSLASLEFIATAARDPRLTPELESRMRRMLALYTDAALANSGSADDPIPPAERGTLLAALEQGIAFLSLSGVAPLPDELIREGMLRLLTPLPAEPSAP
ncbi:TetR/AcrR family transcriptional regulator [Cellulomonas chengniuliangii]|uniref:TetR/AcrR family transcriptional regulator n=1 Tax=Cellulomonas chengniuliangii TaxID=2968084 RepID=A0ABY5L013_9CELL|nr:TetR/AcrR family transcriptional regulator [Cellulomonas chengniuliangii]MCC2307477.1 TetR/AcrR family transcriptional regulator [Cellulomonas chengniuliangii]UUI75749.1 TetR/AcrR family transcriptional regulator [Cellulomonas chengniuliangii]